MKVRNIKTVEEEENVSNKFARFLRLFTSSSQTILVRLFILLFSSILKTRLVESIFSYIICKDLWILQIRN